MLWLCRIVESFVETLEQGLEKDGQEIVSLSDSPKFKWGGTRDQGPTPSHPGSSQARRPCLFLHDLNKLLTSVS